MKVLVFDDIKRAIHEGSQASSKLLAQALKETNRASSAEVARQYTIGSRLVLARTSEAWLAGAHELSTRMTGELDEALRAYSASQTCELQASLSEAQLVLTQALDASTKTIGKLEGDMLHSSAQCLVRAYKTSLEASYKHLLETSLKATQDSLLLLVQSSVLSKRHYMGKHISRSIEEAMISAYQILQKTIEEGARRTLTLYHTCFLTGQTRLYEMLQLGFEKGVDHASSQITHSLRSAIEPLQYLQSSTLDAFILNLERNLQLVLSHQAKCLAQAQCVVLEQGALDLTNVQMGLIKTGLSRLFKDQRRSVEVSVLPWTLSFLESQ